MLRTEMSPEHHQTFQEWISSEWDKNSDLRASFEKLVATALLTANLGGLGAAIAFTANVKAMSQEMRLALYAFTAGFILILCAIVFGLYFHAWMCRKLSFDHQRFNCNDLDHSALVKNHAARHKWPSAGEILAWFSALSMFVAIFFSHGALEAYMAEKAQAGAVAQSHSNTSIAPSRTPTPRAAIAAEAK